MAKVGRPKFTIKDLKKDWKQSILDLSAEGASIVELAVKLDIARSTLYKLTEQEPEFTDTIKRCKRLCEAWWKRKGRTELDNKEFSYTGWYMNMKNRFGWKDKNETDVNLKATINIEVKTYGKDSPD